MLMTLTVMAAVYTFYCSLVVYWMIPKDKSIVLMTLWTDGGEIFVVLQQFNKRSY